MLSILMIFWPSTHVQAQYRTYDAYITSSTSIEGGVGGDCWESGNEDYTINAQIWDNLDATRTSSNCRTCSANGDCTNNTDGPVRSRSNDPATLYFSVEGWEDDTGNRCIFENTGQFATNDDDCHCSATSSVAITSIAVGSSGNATVSCGGDHSAVMTWTWNYVAVNTPGAIGFTAGCGSFYLNAVTSTQPFVTWYWQGTNANGTSTAFPSTANYPLSAPGTYYLRARGNRNGQWSASSSSILITAVQLNDILDADGDGYTICQGDCNDANAAIHPGALEILCNGIDDNCNGLTDDDQNADGDPVSYCAGDCNDNQPGVYPGAAEILCNGIDENCDGLDDVDNDGDGISFCNGDCDDNNASVYPGAAEVLCNGIDDNCNGNGDEVQDGDGDGFTACDGDCNDADSTVYPGAPDLCDGIENDCNFPKANLIIAGDSWAQFMADDGTHNELFKMYGLADKRAISRTFETEILCSPSPGSGDYAVSGSEARQWADEANYNYLQNLIDAINANPGVDMVMLSIGGNDILAGRSDGGWYKDMDLDVPGSEAALFNKVTADTWYIIQQVWARARPDIEFIISSYDFPNFNVDPLWCWAYACDKREDLSRDANGNGAIDNGELLSDAALSDLMLLVESQRGAMADSDPRLHYDNGMGLMHFYYGYNDGLYPSFGQGVAPYPESVTPYTTGGYPNYPSDRSNFRLVGVCGFVGLFGADPIHLDAEGYEYKIKNQFDNTLFAHYRGTPNTVIWSEPANDGYVDVIGNTVSSSGIRVGDTGPACCSGPATSDYRGILSFNTASIPNDAVIERASIYLMRSSANDNPFQKGDRNPRLDIKHGVFGSAETLEVADGTAAASATNIGCFKGVADNDKYAIRIDVDLSALQYINLDGKTQFRISFDKSDWSPEYINFYDGDGSTARIMDPLPQKPVFEQRTVRYSPKADGTFEEHVVEEVGQIRREEGYVYQEKLIRQVRHDDGSYTNYYTTMRAVEHAGLSRYMQQQYGAPGNGFAPFLDVFYRSDSPQDPLPVTLVQFTGTRMERQTMLSWWTASEINSDRFEVEHSLNARDWKTIGSQRAKGFSSEPADYSFIHPDPFTGVNYYRLKMIDIDETFEYSHVVAVTYERAGSELMNIYPNPFQSEIRVELMMQKEETVEIYLTDMLGHTISSESHDLREGIQSVVLQTKDELSPGVYFITVAMRSKSVSKRLVKE